MTDHFRPTAEIADDVLLPGDPGLALALSQRLLVKPLMANHHHGLWGYSGLTASGRRLTVQATGIGGPSAAVVLTELAAHGARRAIRIGRCVALERGLEPGRALVVTATLADDGASRALGQADPAPDEALTAALTAAGGALVSPVTAAGCDLVAELSDAERGRAWRRRGAAVADLETSAVLATAVGLGIPAGAALAVSQGASGERDEEAVEGTLLELGTLAESALARLEAEPAQAPAPGLGP